MSRELDNEELFELCETIPKEQCSQCPLFWNQGIVYYTFFHTIRDQERALPWCSTRQNWRTERVPYRLECVEEILRKRWLSTWTFHRYSRSIPQRPSLSWITTRNWLDRTKVHRDGRTGKTKSHVPSLHTGNQKIPRDLEQSRQKRAKATSTTFSSCTVSQKPFSSWIWRRSCRTNFTSTTQEMALFLNRCMVGHVRLELVELIIKNLSVFCCSWLLLQSMAIHCNRRIL